MDKKIIVTFLVIIFCLFIFLSIFRNGQINKQKNVHENGSIYLTKYIEKHDIELVNTNNY